MHQVDSRMRAPNIIDYLDYRDFLKAKLHFIQSEDKKKSMRWMAKKAGIQSPQLISMVLSGKRNLSKEVASALSFAMDLTDDEEEYLFLLIDLQDSKIADQREDILQRIRTQFKGGLFNDLDRDDIEYLSQWYYPVLREAVGIYSPKEISDLLGISSDEVDRAYEFLIKLGLVKWEDGKLVKHDGSLWIQDNLSPMVMMKFHYEMLNKAIDELKVKKEQQHFQTLTVSMPSNKIPELKKKMHQFICEIDTWLEELPAHDQVIQLNVNFFSWLQDRK